jgi:glycine cleavage system H protein
MNVPEENRYTASHEWVRMEGDTAAVGVTDHAQNELTDVVYVELPGLGKTVSAGEQICVVESVKAASDIYAPVSGKVVAVNEELSAHPEWINTDPFGKGWIFKLQASTPSEVEGLKTAAQYLEQISNS